MKFQVMIKLRVKVGELGLHFDKSASQKSCQNALRGLTWGTPILAAPWANFGAHPLIHYIVAGNKALWHDFWQRKYYNRFTLILYV